MEIEKDVFTFMGLRSALPTRDPDTFNDEVCKKK